MEHDQRVCPRCGAPGGDYRFCESCSSKLDSLNDLRPVVGASSASPTQSAAQVLMEVARLEQALAAASKGITDRIATRGIEADPGQRPAENDRADTAALERARILTSPDKHAGDPTQPHREVARLEEVLTVPPKRDSDVIDRVPPPSVTVEPPPFVEPPAPAAEPAPACEPRAAEPTYIAAQLLREAFWFELASAADVRREIQVPAVEAEHGHLRTESVPPPQSVPPPDPAATSCPPPSVASPQVAPQQYAAPPSQQRSRLPALFVLGLVGLLVLLVGRRPRRASAVAR